MKEYLLSHLFYADKGHYKVFYLADNSPESPLIFSNNFDKFLYSIKE